MPGQAAKGAELPPLSVRYVYARQRKGEQEWLEVGGAVRDGAEGWLPATAAMDWRQTLTVAFARRQSATRVVFP
ncbi:hypothetical protein [Chromatium okenii]|uniref:Uncharacterized protein n=1 Tax=Chromatium okenii TaxID=61644 RepID=A0A2S7XNX0_9GAMM|nr:hypothetical protein [Chromatium okenii]PQJ95415.1 hypothetical protein CXB77_14475 [Chromatium okenii]